MPNKKFCECKSIYTIKLNSQSGNYENYCKICEKYIPLDTFVLHEVVNVQNNEKKSLNKIQAAIYDDTYMTIDLKCISCDNKPVKYFMTEDMKRIYVCDKCKKYW